MSCFWRTTGVALVATLLVAVAEQDAWSYSCITTSCSAHCQSPVSYKLGTPSGDLGLATTEAELKKGMEAWAAPACSSLKVQYAGTTSEAPSNANGVIAWVESGWKSGGGTIGVTTSRLSSKCIASHMVMNGVNFRWITGKPASRGEVNAFTIIAHEGGHYVGLSHSNVGGSVMAAQYSGGVTPLNGDDEAGICKIYPGGGGMAVPGAGPSPGTPASPGSGGAGGGGSAGSGGSSGGGVGSGTLCTACQVGGDCASGTCVRNNSSGQRFCGQSCEGGCPGGYQCATIDAAQGLRQCVPNGGSCMLTAAPGSGTGGAAGMAGSGSGGQGGNVASGAGGAAASGGPVPPPASMSSAECAEDDDCAANERCNGDGACEPNEEGRLVVADGESCEVNEDCQSRLCVERSDGAFCSRLCSKNSDCVSGFACEDEGQEKLCAPIEPGKRPSAGEPLRSDVGCSMAAGSEGRSGLVMLGVFAFLFGITLRAGKRLNPLLSKGLVVLLLLACANSSGCMGAADSDDLLDDEEEADEGSFGGSIDDRASSPRGGGAGRVDKDANLPPRGAGGQDGNAAAGGRTGGDAGNIAGSGGRGGSGGSGPVAGSGASPAPSPRGGSGGSSAPPTSPPPGAGGAPSAAAGCSVTLSGGNGKEPGGSIPVCCTPAPSDKAMIEEVFSLLNAHRMANGRAPLEYDPKLEASIQAHCQHMAEHSFFSHTAPEAAVASFSARAKACGVAATGENIALQQRSANEVMTSWKNSAGHNMNMLNSAYKRVGIGQYKLRWGQMFGR